MSGAFLVTVGIFYIPQVIKNEYLQYFFLILSGWVKLAHTLQPCCSN